MAGASAAAAPRRMGKLDGWIRLLCALVVAGVLAYASYVHQRDFALQGDADEVSTSLWPLSVDGLLLLATVDLLKPTPFAPAGPAVRGAPDLGGRTAPRRQWLVPVTVAWRKFLDAARADTAPRSRELRVERELAPRPAPALDDTPRLHFLCAHPSLTLASAVALTLRAVGRADHPPDRPNLTGTRDDHGVAHQPGQTHRLRSALRPSRRRRHRAARPLPALRRGLLRRHRPLRRGHPAHPPTHGPHRPPRCGRAARPPAAPSRPAHRRRTGHPTRPNAITWHAGPPASTPAAATDGPCPNAIAALIRRTASPRQRRGNPRSADPAVPFTLHPAQTVGTGPLNASDRA